MRLATAKIVIALSPLVVPSPRAPGSAGRFADRLVADPHAAPVPSPTASGQFAGAIAVSGNDVLVSSLNLPKFRGVNGVHVFRRTGPTRWVETVVLTPGDSMASERFGAALSADGPLLAVLDPGAAQGGQGAVYIFERDRRGRWQRRARLSLDTTGQGATGQGAVPSGAGNRFRSYVVLRHGLLVVGVEPMPSAPGRVAVFRRGADAGQWTEQRAVTPAGAEEFGTAATMVGDRLVVSAATSPAGRGGDRLYVLHDSAGTWVAETTIDVPGDVLRANAVANATGRHGPLVGDGAELWVGYPEADSGRGAVLHFRRGDTTGAGVAETWTLVERLTPGAPDTLPNLGFGLALARAGGDLVASAPAAGAANASAVAVEAGMLHVFRSDRAGAGSGTGTARSHRFGAAPAVPWAKLGGQLAAAGTLLAAVAPRVSGGLGGVVLFERLPTTGTWRERAVLLAPLPVPLARPITGPRPCSAGQAAGFDCKGVELLSFLPARAIGSKIGPTIGLLLLNGLWGWTDSATGREFALVGRVDATAFVEVTDPAHPRYLGELPLHPGARPSIWRDIKVYQNYAFVVSDAAGSHGMQIFDLTQLRDVRGAPVTFTETARYDQLGTAHTLALNEATGYAYAVSVGGEGENCGGQLHMIDVHVPTRPTFAGCYANPAGAGTHETMCVVYHGPDAGYRGHELCFNANGPKGLEIVDVTDKKNPKSVSVATYPNLRYTHQGWLTEDQRYFLLNDESDPGDARGRTRTVVFDLHDLGDPVVAKEFFSSASATAHNLYVRGRYVYESNYKAGLRIYDIADPKNPDEVAYLDTTPGEVNDAEFGGSWTNYPYFRSGAVGVASMAEGLFMIRLRSSR